MPVRRIGGTRYRNSCLDLAVQAFGSGTRSRVRDRELHEGRKHVREPVRIVRHRQNRLCCLEILNTEAQQVGIATSIYDMVLVRERDHAQGTRDRLNSSGIYRVARPHCRAGHPIARVHQGGPVELVCLRHDVTPMPGYENCARVRFGMELRMGTISSGKWPDGSLASPVDRVRYPVRISTAMLSEIRAADSFTQSPARCPYGSVVCTSESLSRRPIMGRLSPSASARDPKPCWQSWTHMSFTKLTFYSKTFFFSLMEFRKRFGSDCAPTPSAAPDHLCASLSNPS